MMNKLQRIVLILTVLAAIGAGGRPAQAQSTSPTAPVALTLNENDRILVLAPHPDDEVLACGGIIQAALAKKLPVRIVYFTYGDNNEWAFLLYRKHPVLEPRAMKAMGEIRHGEALAAGRALGVTSNDQEFLGYPDFGTLFIWDGHWGAEPPFRSMLTHVTQVPYADALRPGAAYKGEEIIKDLEGVLREFKPTRIFVSHPADHHPDHRALYLFTRVALWELESEMKPELWPYLVHFKGWPRPLTYQPDIELTPPPYFADEIAWHSFPLTPGQVGTKRLALLAHASEIRATPGLIAFVRPNELFGNYPVVRLSTVMATPAVPGRTSFGALPEMQEYLSDNEREAFVGIEDRLIGLEDGKLTVRIRLSRPLAKATEISVQAFGFRPDRPFQDMPKIHVKLGALNNRVLDQNRVLPDETVEIERSPKEIVVRIPLAVLGAPDRVLTSAHTYLGDVSLDWVAWREIFLAD